MSATDTTRLRALCDELWDADCIRAAKAAIPALCDEVDRLRARIEETEHAMHMRIRAGYDRTIADSWRAEVTRAVAAERDALRAEWQRHVKGTEDTVRLLLPHTLATARREGAEAMREHTAEACEAFAADSQRELEEHGDGERDTAQWIQGRESGASMCAELIRALPLPGDATGEHAPTEAP